MAVIMITPYDPFGLNWMVYTVKSRCVEETDMEYEDGACTIFLYTKGTKGCPGKELKQLLHYMEDTAAENAVNSDLEKIQRMVEAVKIAMDLDIDIGQVRDICEAAQELAPEYDKDSVYKKLMKQERL